MATRQPDRTSSRTNRAESEKILASREIFLMAVDFSLAR
jgi:hypothetical protein